MQRFLQRAGDSGLEVIARLPGLRTVRVRYDQFRSLQSELVAHSGDYETISANFLVTIPIPPAHEDRPPVNQIPFGNRALEFLGIDHRARENAEWGRGVTIAILDSGVGGDPTFGSGRLTALDIGLGTAPGTGDDDGHATAVAALAAGSSPDARGVAPAANVLSIRVTDTDGTSDLFTVAHAIVAAVDAGARIINLSLGGDATGAILDQALEYAAEQHAVIVAAAGNDQAARLAWRAADPRVLSVGAVDAAEQQVAFSNSGPQLQLTAPGYGVQTAWLEGLRVEVDGTSASAALVAGALAAVMSRHPGLTAPQAAALLAQTASDAGPPGSDPAFGHGILNLDWAMNHNRTGYVDTAISAHHFDAAGDQMQIVIQNRSSQPVTGLSLNVTPGTAGTSQTLPTLMPGEIHVAQIPVGEAARQSAGGIAFTTQLFNPAGVIDAVPANNQRRSVLPAPAAPDR